MNRNVQRASRDAREQEAHDRLGRMLQTIMERQATATGVYSRVEGLMELEEIRLLACSTYPPQLGAAVQATIGKCKLMGLMVDKKQDIPSDINPLQGPTAEQEQVIIERLRERVGSAATNKFIALIENMRRAYDGDQTIEGEAYEIPETNDGVEDSDRE